MQPLAQLVQLASRPVAGLVAYPSGLAGPTDHPVVLVTAGRLSPLLLRLG